MQSASQIPAFNELQAEGQVYYYKVVARLTGKLLSIYDGKTEYVIGKNLQEEVRPQHGGGFYVYPTIEEAVFAEVPNKKDGLYFAPRTVLKCMCWGARIEYERGKIAFENLCPVQDLGMPRGYLATKEARRDALKKYEQELKRKKKESILQKKIEWLDNFKIDREQNSKPPQQPYTISTRPQTEQKTWQKSKKLSEPLLIQYNMDEI